MANYLSFMVTTRHLATDDPAAVRAVLARFCVAADGDSGPYHDDGLYFSEETPGTFWIGGYDAADPGDLTLGDVDLARDADAGDDACGADRPSPDVTLTAALQPLIRPGTAWAYQTVGYEKLRYVWGHVVVVTRDRAAHDDLDAAEGRLVRELLPPGVAAPAD